MRRFSIWASILVMTAALFSPTVSTAQPRDAAGLLADFSSALNAGNVEGAVAFFAENGTVSTVTQGGEEFVGRDRVRVWVERLVAGHFHVELDPTYEGGPDQVTWSTRLWLDPWRDLGVTPAVVIVTVTASDGRIQTFNSRVDDESARRLQASTSTLQAVDAFFASLNAGDLAKAVALLDDSVVILGALGDRVQGRAEAQAYYERLISQHLQVEVIGSWQIAGDRASAVYGLSVDSLRAVGITSAETMGQLYVRDGRITVIEARFTPGALAAIQSPTGPMDEQ
jgi:limonene-1,2-epoxide hydrolase